MPHASDWLYGSLDLLVLRTLAMGPAHGFGVSEWIRRRSDDALQLEDAALYKALHRLERLGLVRSSWGATENNRQARWYELTAEGRRALRRQREAWLEWAALMQRLLAPA